MTMNATDAEIYNAIDASVYFAVADIDELACAIQRTATDPMAFIEVGKMYTAMVREVIKGQRERSAKRASENNGIFKDILGAFCPQPSFPEVRYTLCDDITARKAGLGA
jgi:hypothetical protein